MAETEADISARLVSAFENAGAERIEPGYLQPADVLLDLYGEDIRARAYTTHDPVHGEQMLRPDFTVPVAQMHLKTDRQDARYTYAGPVWRRQEYGSTRAREFWQVGFEVFGGASEEEIDAEVFARFSEVLRTYPVTPILGDLGLVFAGIETLEASERRKAALRRHVWRPRRFNRLLQRFAGQAPFDCDIRDLPQHTGETKAIGLRGRSDVDARLSALREEREDPPLARGDIAMLEALLGLSGPSTACLRGARAIARGFSGLTPALDRLERRLDALAKNGIDPDATAFDAGLGRDAMEYYDGFVFAFRSSRQLPDVAAGGRYDALARALGGGSDRKAVGGVIRPAILADMGAP